MTYLGHPAYYLAAGYVAPPFIVLLGIGAVLAVTALTIPVLSDKITAFLSAKGSKAAPPTFLIGLAILLAGFGTHAEVLQIVGGCMVGLVVIGVILDNY